MSTEERIRSFARAIDDAIEEHLDLDYSEVVEILRLAEAGIIMIATQSEVQSVEKIWEDFNNPKIQ